MDEKWQQKLILAHEQGQRLFDAPLFRFIEATSQMNGSLHLVLGDTSYKEYVTTRTPDFAKKHARQHLGNPLAVCSVVETSDNYILLDKRQGVDVYVGRYHVIGGFFERELDMEDTSQIHLPRFVERYARRQAYRQQISQNNPVWGPSTICKHPMVKCAS